MEPGFLFLTWSDVVRTDVLSGNFERAERKFVQRFLQAGMIFFDVGSYFGIYALTASMRVGKEGCVIAFEPSPHQMRRLKWNLWLNRCKNVRTESTALGGGEGESEFFVPTSGSEGFSSLRRPGIPGIINSVRVRVTTLDAYMHQNSLKSVDFIKVDIEGGELDFLRGAEGLLQKKMRPVILCELQDIRSAVWGHSARDVALFLQNFGFRWFRVLPNADLSPVPCDATTYEGNFIAVPEERMCEVREMIEDGLHVSA